jgi:hypothetical protein
VKGSKSGGSWFDIVLVFVVDIGTGELALRRPKFLGEVVILWGIN